MAVTERGLRTQAWNRYWSTGAAHSCADSFDLNGDGGLARFWNETFSVTGSPANIVDLATGNGALLQAADAFAQREGKSWKMTGIDIAQPAPAWFDPILHQARIDFKGETPMESTGLPAHETDLLISQFGIEYGDRGDVQTECMRLLRKEGRFAFVIHHDDSVITQVARDELLSQSFLLAKDGLIAAVNTLLPQMARVRAGSSPGTRAHSARDAFNDAMERGSHLARELSAPDLLQQSAAGAQQFIALVNMDNADELQQRWRGFRDEVVSAQVRTEEQLECAMDSASLDSFLEPFRLAGYKTNIEQLFESNHLVGWGVTGRAI